jgi:UDP-glucose 4-epimerase
VRVLVTGGAGFIGSNLCRRLASTGLVEHVAVLDDLSTGSAGNLADVVGAGVQLHVGSILDVAALERAADGVTAIVHLAARPSVSRSLADPLASHLANATGTLQVLEVARRTGAHVVAASSSSVYGATATLPKHEGLAARPMSPYAASNAMLTWRNVFSSSLVSSATRVELTATVRSTSRP